MIRAASIVAVACLVSGRPSAQVFSSRVEGVRVDALVTDDGRRPLRGLRAEDFEIRDNGVPQQVDVVSYGEVALSVALVFDLSESVAGQRLDDLRAASTALTRELQPGDETALVTFEQAVSMPCPLSTRIECIGAALQTAAPARSTALVDGVFAGLMIGESDVGRSVLIVFSDGMDTASFLPPSLVLDTARRSDAVVYAVATKASRLKFLEDVTELTGGRLYEVDGTKDLTGVFRGVLDEFRHRYLLTYTPRNVTRAGWHKLDVKVKRPGARTKARPGYQG